MAEIVRKIMHISICCIALLLFVAFNAIYAIIASIIGLYFLWFLYKTPFIRYIKSVRPKHNMGELYIFIGIILIFLLHLADNQKNTHFAIISLTTLGLGDTIATVFKNRLLNSLCVALVCSIVYVGTYWLLLGIDPSSIWKQGTLYISSFALCITNFYSRKGTDNITIPLIIELCLRII